MKSKKDVENKMKMMKYMVEKIESKLKELLKLREELDNVEKEERV
jgi:hypothetical protein